MGMALGKAAYKSLSNIILGKITSYIQNIKGEYKNEFTDG
jgi:hypothetical protein